jgi:glycosyltransferase involved in cell wall biosynthesis
VDFQEGEAFPEEEAVVAGEEVGDMRLSIVIIALNEEDYIYKLLDCLKEQTFQDLEVIVVDGNSEDKTVEVVKGYQNDLDINIIISKERGPSKQRNKGAENAKYDRLVFFDADVKIPPYFLEDMVRHASKSGVDCFSTFFKSIEDKLIYKLIMGLYNEYIYLMQFYGVSAGPFIYVKKEVFDNLGGFDEHLVYSEDRDFTHRLVKEGYKFKIYRKPVLMFSCRRFEKEGPLNLAMKVFIAEIKQLFGKKYNSFKSITYEFGNFGRNR